MKGQAAVLHVERCIHPHWPGHVRLFVDGTFAPIGTRSRGPWHPDDGVPALAGTNPRAT